MRDIYSVGDTLRSGHEVINIYGDTGHIAVVETPEGVRWEVTRGPDYAASIFEEFHRIHCTIPSGVSKEMRETLNKQLAAALFNALTSDNKKEALGTFEAVRLRINKVLTPAQVNVCFYGFTILSSSVIALCFYLLPSTFYLLPSTFYLLPSTFYLLPSTFYLLPSIFYLPANINSNLILWYCGCIGLYIISTSTKH